MRMHFRTRHNKDTIVIEDEGRLPRCAKCGLFQKDVGLAHQQMAACLSFAQKLSNWENQDTNKRIVSETVFLVNGLPIKTGSQFKYLGRALSKDDSD
jgi:hypothetical protein